MNVSYPVMITILGMAFVTYISRIGGLFLMNRMKETPRLEAWLKSLPGCILTAIVAPLVLTSGFAEALSGLVCALVAWRSKNLIAAMVTGVVCVWVFR